jgi:uncharacterized protein (DUF4415 family)
MHMTNTKTHTLEELRALRDSGKTRTVPASQAPVGEVLPDDFWDDAEMVMPTVKTPVNLRVDSDVLEYFKGQGKGHLTRMHAVLRSYVEAQKARS